MSDGFFRQNSADQDKKLDAELAQIQGLEVFRQRVVSPDEALLLDDNGAGTIYVGTAVPGASPSAPVWKIKQILTTGADLRILWADGNSQYDNIWDDRSSLTYI
jgi:hypothetical protein